jgi:uncharacterized membrane protein
MNPQRLLLLSAAINILLVSGIGGAALMWTTRLSAGAPPQEQRRPLALEGLSAEHAAALQTVLETANRDVKEQLRTSRDQRRAAADLFVQPTFDSSAVNAALEQARDADLAVRTEIEKTIVSFAATLPAGERASLAEELKKGGPLRQPNPQRPNGDVMKQLHVR